MTPLFSASTCSVSQGHVGVLQALGVVLGIGAVLSIATGRTYFRRVISRDGEPGNYWSTVICLSVLAVLDWGMLYGCPHV